MSPRPKRLPPVMRNGPPQQVPGAHEARLMAQRASLRDLQALAEGLGLSPNMALSWHGRRLNIGQAKADAGAMIKRRQRLADGRMSLRR